MTHNQEDASKDILCSQPDFAHLPKVDKLTLLLTQEAPASLNALLLTAAAREAIGILRTQMANGQLNHTGKEDLLQQGLCLAREFYKRKSSPSLRKVINWPCLISFQP
jgi:hypothetical protein